MRTEYGVLRMEFGNTWLRSVLGLLQLAHRGTQSSREAPSSSWWKNCVGTEKRLFFSIYYNQVFSHVENCVTSSQTWCRENVNSGGYMSVTTDRGCAFDEELGCICVDEEVKHVREMRTNHLKAQQWDRYVFLYPQKRPPPCWRSLYPLLLLSILALTTLGLIFTRHRKTWPLSEEKDPKIE